MRSCYNHYCNKRIRISSGGDYNCQPAGHNRMYIRCIAQRFNFILCFHIFYKQMTLKNYKYPHQIYFLYILIDRIIYLRYYFNNLRKGFSKNSYYALPTTLLNFQIVLSNYRCMNINQRINNIHSCNNFLCHNFLGFLILIDFFHYGLLVFDVMFRYWYRLA